MVDSKKTQNLKTTVAAVTEFHALSSATKPLSGWLARDAIQDCREACGGHGYLKGFLKSL